jgi:regulator of protease activity HflC (stomatin/prohibitin superfamily)
VLASGKEGRIWTGVDPKRVVSTVPDVDAWLYRLVQFAIREAVASRTLDEVLSAKNALDAELRAYVRERVAETGIEVTELGVKDVILPGEIRELVNKVVEAERTAKANLIRRQEETAATRSLLNTAKLMEDNPLLLRLKELESIERLVERSAASISTPARAGPGCAAQQARAAEVVRAGVRAKVRARDVGEGRVEETRPILLRRGRQIDRHGRALAGRARERDAAAGLAGEALDRAEAQAPTLAAALGREERIEGPPDRLGLHAAPIVGDGDRDIRAGRDPAQLSRLHFIDLRHAGLEEQPAAFRHRIAGVVDQVHDGRFQRSRIGHGRPQIAVVRNLDPNGVAENAAEPFHQFDGEAVDRDGLRPQRQATGDREEAPGQLGGALGRFLDQCRHLMRRGAGFELGHQHLAVAQDRHQDC